MIEKWRLRNLNTARGEPTTKRLDSGRMATTLEPSTRCANIPLRPSFSKQSLRFRSWQFSQHTTRHSCSLSPVQPTRNWAPSQLLEGREPDPAEPVAGATHSNSPREESLGGFAKNLGSALNELATIVHPTTIRRWIREASDKVKLAKKSVGRPRTAEQIEILILKLAIRTIRGLHADSRELKKLGIESVTRNTVEKHP